MMKKIFVPIVIIAIILGILYAIASKPEPRVRDDAQTAVPAVTTEEEKGTAVTYACAGGKEIEAQYFPSRVKIMLDSGATLDLQQAQSISGTSYTNADGSVVFWNKGNTASVVEGEKETHTGCVESDPEVPTASSTQVTPLELVEDSRCPMNARCIQAGTVRVRVRVADETTVLTLSEPKTVAGKVVTLTSVLPEPIVGKTYTFTDYKFTFTVK